jgi:hypothetical protein
VPGLDDRQLYVSLFAIALAAWSAGLLVLRRDGVLGRKMVAATLCVAAVAALVAWTNFGKVHGLWVDAPGVVAGNPRRAKIEERRPFHAYEFFHYYMGAKYFRELGYEGLYDCTALADGEIAVEDGYPARITGWVRDLDDVLRDKTYLVARKHCTDDIKPNFSAARWASYKNDLRELRKLVGDGFWPEVVGDAGFNPPPSWCVFGSAVANAIPIRIGASFPGYLLCSSIDMVLLLVCFVALYRAFGLSAAATFGVFLGASLIAAYGWNGGAFLRYTWLTALIVGLFFLQRGKWAWAGVLLAMSTCDRLFPAAFAVGAVIPVAWRSLRSAQDRRRLVRFGVAFGATTVVLCTLGAIVFDLESWHVFFMRIFRHGDVYYGMHIGLKKVVTWRDWTPRVNFGGHQGLAVFHDWNLRLRETYRSMWWLVIPVQLAAAGGAAYAGIRRRPHESALLMGIVGMFFFNLPANYYYVVLAVVPAVLLVAAMRARSQAQRGRELAVLGGFYVFWVASLLFPRSMHNVLILNHAICATLLAFLAVWIFGWAARRA